jgi:hypothetical protein
VKETRSQRRRRLHAGWTDEDLRQEEDEIFARTSYVIRLQEELVRLAKVPKDFAVANRARTQKADERAAIARKLSAEGKSGADIARLAKVSLRTVQRWMNRDTS